MSQMLESLKELKLMKKVIDSRDFNGKKYEVSTIIVLITNI